MILSSESRWKGYNEKEQTEKFNKDRAFHRYTVNLTWGGGRRVRPFRAKQKPRSCHWWVGDLVAFPWASVSIPPA